MSADEPKRPYARIAFDMATRRPGCALIQALHDCFVRDEQMPNPASHFNADIWIVGDPSLKVYEIETKELFDRIVERVNAEARRP